MTTLVAMMRTMVIQRSTTPLAVKTPKPAVVPPSSAAPMPSLASQAKPVTLPKGGRARGKARKLMPNLKDVSDYIGIDPTTLNTWKRQGCPGIDSAGSDISQILKWREDRSQAIGEERARLSAAQAGTMTIAEMDAEIKYHQLLKVKLEFSRDAGEWVLLDTVDANFGRLLGRIVGLLRIMPVAARSELGLSRQQYDGLTLLTDEMCRIVNMDRVINGDPEDRNDEQMVEAMEREGEAAADPEAEDERAADKAALDAFLTA